MSLDPYAPPAVASAPVDACPKCGAHDVRTPAFTWWGGAIGPRILNHRVCGACKFGFNAKTRRSNTRGIIVYQVAAFTVAIGAVLAFWAWNRDNSAMAFIHGCAGSCVKSGGSPTMCQPMCECIATDLRRGGDAHFRQIVAEAAKNGAPSPELTESAERCRATHAADAK